ncbi:MAG: hypothetical protein EXR64_05395 [Dehalococcoidia bacterium]|nr:hypothetical protein [Dehalococcoidia bacterium]
MHPDTLTRTGTAIRSAVLGVVALAILATMLLAAAPAEAQTLPYKAYGAGLLSGEVVRAFKGGAQVGQAVVNAAGNWDMNIFAGGDATVSNGDRITFTVGGRVAAESVTFAVGQFVPPPGLVLTVAATPPPAPGTGTFAGTPIFDSTGRALAVFMGGTVDQLATAAAERAATGIWVQDGTGAFQLYVIGGPVFLNQQFRSRFSSGFPGVTSVLLMK